MPSSNHTVADALSAATDQQLLDALIQRGFVISAWSAEDLSFLDGQDWMSGLTNNQVKAVKAGALESCGRGLQDILAQRGNDHLADWCDLNKDMLLAAGALAHAEAALPREAVCSILAGHDEDCSIDRIGYFPDIEGLAAKVASAKNWTMGEVFVYAQSAEHFIVMKQIAPSSCEMLTITPWGIADVLTAYRYDHHELVALLQGYLSMKGQKCTKS